MHKVYFKKQSGTIAQLIKYNQKFLDEAIRSACNVGVIVGEVNDSARGLSVQDFYSLDHDFADDIEVITFGCDDGGVYAAVLADPSYTFKSVQVYANTARGDGTKMTHEEITKYDLVDKIKILSIVLEV